MSKSRELAELGDVVTVDSGNVGIGTSSPAAPLTVNHSTSAGIRCESGGTLMGGFQANTSDAILYAYSSNPIKFAQGNGGSERMRIDSSGNVGIGETSPDAKLHIRDATDGGSTSVTSAIQFSRRNGGVNDAAIKMQHDGSDGVSNLQFHFGASERMRIDSSGNLLVGTTSNNSAGTNVQGCSLNSDGQIDASRNGASLDLNRISTDGAIANFRKNGTTVGSIGTGSGTMYIGSGTNGLKFDSGIIRSWNPTTNAIVSDARDIGASDSRFKNLYLSGGVYLGGTGSANYLDDYEEGTFTPTIKFNNANVGMTYSAQVGTYTKIGNTVHVVGYILISNKGTSTGNAIIDNFPFASLSGSQYAAGSFHFNTISHTGFPHGWMNNGQISMNLGSTNTSGGFAMLQHTSFNSGSGLIFTCTYKTTA